LKQYPFHILNCFFQTSEYKKIVRNEISDLCEYGFGFNFDIVYNLPVSERKIQLKLLQNNLEEKKQKNEENSDKMVLTENTPLSKIKQISSKFDKDFTYKAPKK
jgi:hypothetical protein